MKINGKLSETSFKVTKGIRQGSKVSPMYFSIYVNDLLVNLTDCDAGFRLDNFKVNHISYADDLTLLCRSATGLQRLLDICHEYSRRWR